MTLLTLYIPSAGLEHHTGQGHPECPERLKAILSLLDKAPFDKLPRAESEEAPLKAIKRAHDSRYIDRLEESVPDYGHTNIDGDTVLSPGSFFAAAAAAGAVCQAVDDIIDQKTTRAFCAVRPPGHHAFPDHAEGFCLFNNVMIGARHAQARGLERIAIIDFDVHHGNGTDAMTRKADNIFYTSTHQGGIYPGTGTGLDNIAGKILNVPMMAGEGTARFRAIYNDVIFPALHAFKPDLLMISAGFDAHKDDPLAQINLETEDFGWITAQLVKIAQEHCAGKILSVLEGGYNLAALSAGVEIHLKELMV